MHVPCSYTIVLFISSVLVFMYRSVFTVGIALIQGFNFVSDYALTNYSYVNIDPGVTINTFFTRCFSGLGPSGNDNNSVLGGLYFNGSRIPIANTGNGIRCSLQFQDIIQVGPAPYYAGIINMHQCGEFSTTAEGVYTYIMLNSSMMNESAKVGLYFSGRSELVDLYIIIITSTSDLQPSTAIANQLPGQLVSRQIRTRGPNFLNSS